MKRIAKPKVPIRTNYMVSYTPYSGETLDETVKYFNRTKVPLKDVIANCNYNDFEFQYPSDLEYDVALETYNNKMKDYNQWAEDNKSELEAEKQKKIQKLKDRISKLEESEL